MKQTDNRGILKVLGDKCRSEFFVLSIFYSKTCVKWPLSKRQKIGFQDQLSLNAGQKYYRMLQGEHSAILSTFIKLPFVIKIFVLSIFGWPFYTGLTVFIYINAAKDKWLFGIDIVTLSFICQCCLLITFANSLDPD